MRHVFKSEYLDSIASAHVFMKFGAKDYNFIATLPMKHGHPTARIIAGTIPSKSVWKALFKSMFALERFLYLVLVVTMFFILIVLFINSSINILFFLSVALVSLTLAFVLIGMVSDRKRNNWRNRMLTDWFYTLNPCDNKESFAIVLKNPMMYVRSLSIADKRRLFVLMEEMKPLYLTVNNESENEDWDSALDQLEKSSSAEWALDTKIVEANAILQKYDEKICAMEYSVV